MINKMNKLFDELWWFSDESEPMKNFVKAIKKYTKNMKGNVYVELIDLFDFGYEQGHIYIAFDDLSGGELCIYRAADFIEYYKEIMNEYPELEPQEFWIPKLKEIINNYE